MSCSVVSQYVMRLPTRDLSNPHRNQRNSAMDRQQKANGQFYLFDLVDED